MGDAADDAYEAALCAEAMTGDTMTEYDNANKGSAFQPYPDMRLSGSGKLDVEGSERSIVVVKQRLSRDGEPTLVVYQKIGVLFPNDKKGNDKAPDYSGPTDLPSGHRLSAWRGHTEKAGHFLSIRASIPERQGSAASTAERAAEPGYVLDDDIPF